jgi:thioredoxin-like negative regulator of GroEL
VPPAAPEQQHSPALLAFPFLNADDHNSIAVRYNISGIPSVLIFKRGIEQPERIVGLTSEQNLAKAINRVLGNVIRVLGVQVIGWVIQLLRQLAPAPPPGV